MIEKERYYFRNIVFNEQEKVQHNEYSNIRKGKCNLSVESFLQPFFSMMSDYL